MDNARLPPWSPNLVGVIIEPMTKAATTDPRVLLRVEVMSESLDPERAEGVYWIELIDDDKGHTTRLDMAGAVQLLRSLEHKIHVARAMQADPPQTVTPPA